MPLRVVEGASELIEGASLYKTFTTGLSPVGKPYNRPAGVGNASPFGAVRHQRGESHRRWLITVVLIMPYDTER